MTPPATSPMDEGIEAPVSHRLRRTPTQVSACGRAPPVSPPVKTMRSPTSAAAPA
jgi:hypothetical protein